MAVDQARLAAEIEARLKLEPGEADTVASMAVEYVKRDAGITDADMNDASGLVQVDAPGIWVGRTTGAGGSNNLGALNPGSGEAFSYDMRLALVNHKADWQIFARPWQVASLTCEITFSASGPGQLISRTPSGTNIVGVMDTDGVPLGRPVIFRTTWSNGAVETQGFWKLTTPGSVDADLLDHGNWIPFSAGPVATPDVGGYPLDGNMAIGGSANAAAPVPGMTIMGATWTIGIDDAPIIGVLGSDIRASSRDAETLQGSTGEEWAVTRATSGPVTTIVPDGTVWVDPASPDAAGTVVPAPDLQLTQGLVLLGMRMFQDTPNTPLTEFNIEQFGGLVQSNVLYKRIDEYWQHLRQNWGVA